MNNTQRQLADMVRTEKEDGPKSKNTPVGVLAIPDESTSTLDLNTSWLSTIEEVITTIKQDLVVNKSDQSLESC